jgi:hypothetical protein
MKLSIACCYGAMVYIQKVEDVSTCVSVKFQLFCFIKYCIDTEQGDLPFSI